MRPDALISELEGFLDTVEEASPGVFVEVLERIGDAFGHEVESLEAVEVLRDEPVFKGIFGVLEIL
jgi:hypothetical protein